MYLKIKLITLVLLLCQFTHAADVETSIETKGTGSYFYEEHHPLKYDFGSFTFCLGQMSDADMDIHEYKNKTFSSNSGDENLYNKLNGKQILNQSFNWNNYFDNDDYSFHIKFKKVIGNNQYTHKKKHL